MEFDWKLSLGNLLTIGLVAGGIITGWAHITSSNAENTRDLLTVSARVSAIESNFQTLLRENNLERIEQTRILTELQTDMRYVRETLKR